MTIELISPSLEWMRDVHEDDGLLREPGYLPRGRGRFAQDGKTVWADITRDHTVSSGGRASVVHVGTMPGTVLAMMPAPVIAWAVDAFFLDGALRPRPERSMTVEALRRWTELPEPRRYYCSACDGRGWPRDADWSQEFVPCCPRCGGEGVLSYRADGYEDVGGVVVDRRSIGEIARHLRGDVDLVAIGVRASRDGPWDDLHIRHVVPGGHRSEIGRMAGSDCPTLRWGDWRIIASGLPRQCLKTAIAA